MHRRMGTNLEAIVGRGEAVRSIVRRRHSEVLIGESNQEYYSEPEEA